MNLSIFETKKSLSLFLNSKFLLKQNSLLTLVLMRLFKAFLYYIEVVLAPSKAEDLQVKTKNRFYSRTSKKC